MANLATITNNLLADSGVDPINVVVTTGSYSNPAWITSLAWTKITGAPADIVTGTGTTNYIPKFTGSTTLGNSVISQDAGNNVLIGTNTSGYGTLNLQRNSAAPYATLTLGDQATPANEVGIYLRANGSNPVGISSASAPIAFYLGGPGTSEGMRLTSTGLGIGTSSPFAIADVNLSINGSTSSAMQLGVGGTRTGQLFASTTEVRLGSITSVPLRFYTNDSEKMRLDASGNLGLGVTPSAWNTVTAFQVGSTSLGGYSNTGYLNANAFYQTGWKYINSSYAARYEINASDAGNHRWYTAPSGTAGNAISFTQAMTLTANGLLGIGATSPLELLHVKNTSGGNAYVLIEGQSKKMYLGHDGTGAVIYSEGAVPMVFFANGTEYMRITSAGNVGIGTSSPAYKLDVAGDGRFVKSSDQIVKIETTGGVGSGNARLDFITPSKSYTIQNLQTGSANALIFYDLSASAERMRITSGGNVGIGTISPTTYSGYTTLAVNGTTGGILELQNNGTQTGLVYVDASLLTIRSSASSSMRFQTDGANERMRITSGGNVGIGTTTPDYKLTLNAGASDGFKITYSGAPSTYYATFDWNTINANGQALLLNNTSAQNITLVQGGGNVGIGVSPSDKLHVSGNLRVTGTIIDSNNSPGTSGQVLSSTATGTDWVSLSEITGVDGTGTANYIAKWQDANTIQNSIIYDNGSNVGIGTVSPAYKLDVQAAAGIAIRVRNTFNTDDAYLLAQSTLGSALFGINAVGQYLYTGDAIPLLFYNSAVERMRITAAGNVGINTTSPVTKLEIVSADENALRLRNSASQPSLIRFNDTSTTSDPYVGSYGNALAFGIYGVGESMRITSSRNVGIGMSNPTAYLDVKGTGNSAGIISLQLRSGNDYNNFTANQIAFGYNNTDTYRHAIKTRHNSASGVGNNIDFYTWNYGTDTTSTIGSKFIMTMQGDGKIGIGTSSPTVDLDVENSTTWAGLDLNGASGGEIRLQKGGSTYGQLYASEGTSTGFVINAAASGNAIIFQTAGSERMRLTSTGLGIGTSSPGAEFVVNSSNSNTRIFVQNAGSTKLEIGHGPTGYGFSHPTGQFIAYANDLFFGQLSSISTSMSIFASGNVGVGITADGGYKFTVNGNAKVGSGTSSLALKITGDDNYIEFDNTSTYLRGGGNLVASAASNTIFYTASSERMRITSGGSVGIGTSSPQAKLQVSSSTSDGVIVSTSANVEPFVALWRNSGSNGVGVLRLIDGGNIYFDNGATGAGQSTKMVLTAAGNVGIGTTAPLSLLSLLNTIGNGTLSITKNSTYNSEGTAGIAINSTNTIGNTELLIGTDGTNNIGFIQTAAQGTSYSTKNLALQPNGGNIGVNLTAPVYKFQVLSGDNTYATPHVVVTSNNNVVSAGLTFGGLWNSDALNFYTAGSSTAKMYISNAGDVGIGTNNPLRKLHVVGNFAVNSAAGQYYGVNITGGEGANPNILIGDWHNASANITWDSAGRFLRIDAQYSTSGAPIIFSGNDAAIEYMRINYTGNVSIGNTNNTFLLDIGASSLYPFRAISSSGAGFQVNGSYLYSDAYNHIFRSLSGTTTYMTIANTGAVRLHAYGSGSFTGTVAYNLAVDASGNVIETAGGVVDGSGTANYIPKWLDGNTVGNSVIYENGANIGIGVTNADYPLTVGSINVGGAGANLGVVINSVINTAIPSSSVKAIIGATNSGFGYAAGSLLLQPRTGVNAVLVFATEGTEKMRLDYLGNVGIGTTNPQTGVKLDVYGAAAVAGGSEGLRIGNVGDNSAYDNVKLYYTGYNSGAPRIYITPRTTPGSGVISTYLHLQNTNGTSTASNNTMGLLVDGQVGIGTTSPAYLLDIAPASGGSFATIRANNGFTGASDGSQLLLGNSANFTNAYFRLNGGGNSSQAGIGSLNIGVTESAPMAFYTANTERMRIASSGQLMVGGTTVGYGGTKLQVGNTSDSQNGLNILTSTTGYGYILFGDGSGADTYVGQIWYYHADNYMGFQTNGSEKMRITSSGEVAIGRTSAGAKLDIQGTTSNSSAYGLFVRNSVANAMLVMRNDGRFIVGNGTTDNFFVTETGNVGIGTPSPAGQFEVYTDVYRRLFTSNIDAYTIRLVLGANSYIQQDAANEELRISQQYGTGKITFYTGSPNTERFRITNGGDFWFKGTSTSTGYEGAMSNSETTFNIYGSRYGGTGKAITLWATGAGESMRINYTNNVLIGTTTDAGYKLDVNGSGRYATNWSASTTNNILTVERSGGAVSSSIGYDDTNTRMYFGTTTSHALALRTGNTDRVLITSGGNVGIGTTSPAVKLEVYGGSIRGTLDSTYNSENGPIIAANGTTPAKAVHIGYDSAIDAGFISAIHSGVSWKKLVLQGASGNVLIGTTTDAGYKLNVNGSIASNVGTNEAQVFVSNSTSSIYFFNSYAGNAFGIYDGTAGQHRILYDRTNNYLALYTNTSEKLRITSGGNVGIGLTNPSAILHTAGTTKLGGGNLYVSTDQTFVTSFTYSFRDAVGILNPNGVSAAVATSVMSIGNMSNGISLVTTGNVGIGTTSPSYKLDVSGDARISNTNPVLYLNAGNSETVTIGFTQPAVAGYGAYIKATTGLGSRYMSFGISANGTNNNATEIVRFSDTGNVGIGTTSPTYKLQVNADGAGLYVSAAATAPYTQDIAVFRYGGNGNAVKIENQGGKAGIQVRLDNGTATDLSLNATGGNVGIGTVSPGSKLSVSGGNVEVGATYGLVLSGTTTAGFFPDDNSVGAKIQTGGGFRVFTGGANERMRIDYLGNVGIGTTSPSEKLDIYGTGDIKTIIQTTSSGAGANSAVVIKTAADGYWLMQTGNAVSSGLRFYDGTAGSERMRITSAGNTELTGSIKTGAPSGGTAAPWKLGSRISNSCGLPDTYANFVSQFMNTNKVIEVEINGVTVYIPTVTPGWC